MGSGAAMSEPLHLWPAARLVAAYRSGEVSPVDAVHACLARIEALDPHLNAFRFVDADGALAEAAKSAQRYAKCKPRGPADGVPVSVKDTLLVRGWPTLRGSRTVDPDQPWPEDAPAVQRLRESGAVLLGRTTTPEYGWKGVTDSPLTGVTRNPWNPALTPGGSSGGAAVAAATGMAAFNFGTDGGGSIRIPAAFTGVVGLKPSYGRVPAYPPSPFGTLAVVGPLTRTVGDAALMTDILARRDPRDPTAAAWPDPGFPGDLEAGVAGLKIAYAPTLAGKPVDPDIASAVRAAVDLLADAGARVEEAEPPLADAGPLFGVLWAAATAHVVRSLPEERRAMIDPGLAAMAESGRAIDLPTYYAALEGRARLAVAMGRFHERYDLLAMPTEPVAAFAAGHDVPPDGPYEGWVNWTPFTYPFNLSLQPAISVPCGRTGAGLPVGLQLIGAVGEDARVLRAARTVESALPFVPPPL
jgi:aspartyl-tRNA(Asn)/glutamyl-tRNA(Gln) amidotransferase subunit A